MANEPNYSSNPSKDEPKKEKVRVIPLEYIDEFPGHPFKVLDDESIAGDSYEEAQSGGEAGYGQDILHHDRRKAESSGDSEIQVGRTLAFLSGAHPARTDPADHLQAARRMAEVKSDGKNDHTPQS